ncbi:MAG TPA: alanine--glyoxylate aminotransferase family protein, partial [Bacteroidota bacterium]|nr:alanine--glyoxylate aminotransferase family protein [Bacteroidota bacterium]
MPRFYFDIGAALRAHASGDTPWTPAVQLVRGADVALAMMREEGIERIWERHRRLARGLRAGATALGLRLFSRAPSDAVTALHMPEGIRWEDFRGALRERSGLTVAGGQGEFAGKIFRVAHCGYCDEMDVITAVAALGRALESCGAGAAPGAGVAAVERAFAG